MSKTSPKRRGREDSDNDEGTTSADPMSHVITVIMGDHSGDGHGQTHQLVIRCNLSSTKLMNSYRNAVTAKKVPFDVMREVCSKYEQSYITVEQLKQLRDAGLKYAIEDEEARVEDGKIQLEDSEEEYFPLFFAVLEQLVFGGDKDKFRWEKVQTERMVIGAYGMFSM